MVDKQNKIHGSYPILCLELCPCMKETKNGDKKKGHIFSRKMISAVLLAS